MKAEELISDVADTVEAYDSKSSRKSLVSKIGNILVDEMNNSVITKDEYKRIKDSVSKY